jgi:hypothetical protein
MTRPRACQQEVRLRTDRIDKLECLHSRCRNRKDPTIRCQPKERTPHQRWDGEGVVTCEKGFEPSAHRLVMRMVVTMCRQDDVDIEQQHDQRRSCNDVPSSIASYNAAFDVRSNPGRGPLPPRKTGTTGRSISGSRTANSRRRAPSTTAPNVCPVSRARCFAAFRSSSEMDTVVRMMLIIAHQAHHMPRCRCSAALPDRSRRCALRSEAALSDDTHGATLE